MSLVQYGAPAIEKPSAAARLKRGEMVATQPVGPEGHQRRVGSAGHRVFVDTARNRENAADDILLVARRRHDHQILEGFQRPEVRRDRADRFLIVEQHDGRTLRPMSEEHLTAAPERIQQRLVFGGRDRMRRHVEDEKVILSADGQAS